jgi:hypothetical protein
VVEELLVLVAVAVDWRFFYCWRMHFVDVELHWNRAFFDAGIDLRRSFGKDESGIISSWFISIHLYTKGTFLITL